MKKLVFLLVLPVITACCDAPQSFRQESPIVDSVKVDTSIGRKEITDEIAGSAYRKRATAYFVIAGKDTSKYSCIFSESKDDGRVSLDLHIPYSNSGLNYREREKEIKLLLPEAAKDFRFDSLYTVSFGRLLLSGDLAIEITREYLVKYGADDKIKDYAQVAAFLQGSELSRDVNELFKPYSLALDRVSIEKVFFATREDLFKLSKIEKKQNEIPGKILDCILYVKLKKL